MNLDMQARVAQGRVVSMALEVVQMLIDDNPNDPHHSDAVDYAEDQLALAARELVHAIDRLTPDAQPVGWGDGQEKRDRDLIARHLRAAATAINITDWPAYLRECANGHDANASWYRP